MRVFRDAWGIPHLRAGSADELAYLQGRVTAADRGHQMDVERRRSEGRLAELIGPAELPWDRFARRARLDDTARRCFERLDAETRRWVSAYADGVATVLGGWRPWSSLGVFLARHILFGTFPTKMWRAHVERTLGSSYLDLFAREGPGTGGSNAWAEPGRLAGDPHRVIELPGVYQQIRLACLDFDVVGLAFPGVPGVQHFGHTGRVAWAVTNAMADYQDLYREEIRRTPAGVEVREAAGWRAVHAHVETIGVRGAEPESVEVIETPRGPVIDGTVSLRTPSRVGSDLGFGALLPLLRASTVDDVAAALRHWVEPVNSVLVADTSGRTLLLVAGKVPLRDPRCREVPVAAWEPRYAWRPGYAEPPVIEVAGVAVTANDRRPDVAELGVDFAPPDRAERIRALLAEGAPPERIHMDTRLAVDGRGPAEASRMDAGPGGGGLGGAGLGGGGPGGAGLGGGGRAEAIRMDAGSERAGVYAARRAALARRLHEHPALAPLLEPSGFDELFRPWLDPLVRIGNAVHNVAAGLGVAADLVVDGGPVPDSGLVSGGGPVPEGGLVSGGGPVPDAAERWGERHVLEPVRVPGLPDVELPRVELSGDSDCVLATHSIPGVSDACWRGPVARYVWDVGDRARSRWIVPFGASGRPGDPHFADQLPLWAAGELIPVVTDWRLLTEERPVRADGDWAGR